MKYGLDVSHHNGQLNFKLYDKDFVIIRAGYGSSIKQIDKQFVNNVTQAINNKISFAIYWYSYAKTPTQAIEEANACYTIIRQYTTSTTPIFIDIEDESVANLTGNQLSNIAESFVKTMENYGYKRLGVYSSDSWYNKLNVSNKYFKWVARVGKGGVVGTEPKNAYDMWQYSWVEKSPIGNGNFDISKCNDLVFANLFKADFNFGVPDVDGDGEITAHDALVILQNVVGLKGDENNADNK